MEAAQIAIISIVPFILGFIAGYAVRAAISRRKRRKARGF